MIWKVVNTTHDDSTDARSPDVTFARSPDVTPTTGILRFGNLDYQKSFQLKVLDDDVPELEKVIFVQLQIISGKPLVPLLTLIFISNDF